MTRHKILTVSTISFARLIEAWRDAEAFELPTLSRSLSWHLLKFWQFGLLALFGVGAYLLLRRSESFKLAAIWIFLSTMAAWLVFEVSLALFRSLY